MEFEGQYLSFVEYKALGGNLTEMPFNLLEFEARQVIDKYTFGRLKELTSQIKEVKLCCYNLINTLNAYNELEVQNRGIASENIDGYSVTYKSINSSEIDAKNNELGNVVRTYLIDCKLDDGTPYMYRGV